MVKRYYQRHKKKASKRSTWKISKSFWRRKKKRKKAPDRYQNLSEEEKEYMKNYYLAHKILGQLNLFYELILEIFLLIIYLFIYLLTDWLINWLIVWLIFLFLIWSRFLHFEPLVCAVESLFLRPELFFINNLLVIQESHKTFAHKFSCYFTKICE